MRTTFEDAASHFGDGTVDLLHIDGRHYYDDVKQDYTAWEKKLTSNGVVLFHDTNVHERDFGVWKFFKELSEHHPAFEFYHGNGLGVVVPGGVIPDAVRPLFEANADEAAQIRSIYAALGESVGLRLLTRKFSSRLWRLSVRIRQTINRVAFRREIGRRAG